MIAALLALAAAVLRPVFHCGAVERPGIAERGADGVWRGLAVDRCKAAAQAENGPGAAIAFRPYRTMQDLRDARRDALMVLSRAELAVALPAASAPLGMPIAISRQLLLVHDAAWRGQSGLAGQRVCFIVASAAEAALDAWARAAHVPIQHAGFQEPAELRDAFDAGYCAAMAADAREIPGGAAGTVVLGAPLAQLPLFVITR